MSLINRMLQDIDARAGQPGAAPMPGDVRPVVTAEPRAQWRRAALAGGVAVAVVGAAAVGWRLLERVPAPAPVPAPIVTQAPAVAAPVPVPDMPASAPVQVADVAPPAPLAPVAPVAAAVEPEPAPAPVKPVSQKPPAASPMPSRAPVTSGRIEPTAQGAEGYYRRALLVLDDGRVTEAIATLQTGLRIDPGHEPSRQTLVGLLIEAKRLDEAVRQLQTALTLDARQPSMAMLLARLQVERGEDAIATLTRTLPYAEGNGEYHAFLAGVLARAARQREAAEHYGAALRADPHNGVWWMGLGLALQAEKRDADAATAFGQARASGTLSAELQGFVERRLRQLGR